MAKKAWVVYVENEKDNSGNDRFVIYKREDDESSLNEKAPVRHSIHLTKSEAESAADRLRKQLR